MNLKRHSLGIVLLGILLVLVVAKLVSGSLFSYAPDRVQFVVYGQSTRLYSISKKNDVNYFIAYAPDVKIVIPNGYGTYRIGSLSKLTQYEKKPELIAKAFSVATSSFVPYYFYPATSEIYRGETVSPEYRRPSFQEIFFSRSNARLLDRIYLYWKMIAAPSSSFQPLEIELLTSKMQGDTVLSPEVFGEEYKGFFYNKTYRSERYRVQIKYSKSYDTAATIGKILEGNGIRVVDITKSDSNRKQCEIAVEDTHQAQTVRDLSRFFNCVVRQGSPERSDIVLELSSLEQSWEL